MTDKTITLTCKLGTFVFNHDVVISKAKRIRDEVMGQFFTPKGKLPRITTEAEAEHFVRNEKHLSDVAHIPFEVTFAPEYGRKAA